jgi:ABC-type multidrug transport system ATPase subunit
VEVSIRDGESSLTRTPKAFLRQEDSIAFGSLRPADYLQYSALIYGTSEDKFVELYTNFTKELFDRGSVASTLEDRDLKEEQDVGFNSFLDSKIEHLSGGQKRILSIVSTLLLDPRLLLLDEPLSGLDSVSSLQVMNALRVVTEIRQCTVLLVIHQPSEEILAHIDKMIVLNAGKTILDDYVSSRGVSRLSRAIRRSLLPHQRDEESSTSDLGPPSVFLMNLDK